MATDKADKKAVCPKHGVAGTSKQQPPVGQRAAAAVKLCPKCNSMGFYGGMTGCPVCHRGGNVIGIPIPVAPPYPGAVIVAMADGSRAWVDSKTAAAMQRQANRGQALNDTNQVVGTGLEMVEKVATTHGGRALAAGELGVAARMIGLGEVLTPAGFALTGAQALYDFHQTLTAPHDPRDAAPYVFSQHQQFDNSNPTNILGQGTSRETPQQKGPIRR